MTARVLVVDDVDANVKLLEVRLTAEYFEVCTARSGPEALQICTREGTDIVLLDVMMPGMDGFEVCRRLKAEPRTQHIPVIMVTALDEPGDRVKGLEAGADDFLTKPVDDLALITRVKNLARLNLENADGLRLCAQIRSLDRTRHLPIMIIVEPGEEARLLRGLDMGVNDYIVRPVDANELLARVRTQVKRKRYADHLRTRLEETVEMALLDPLTALHNRRYMASHLKTLFEESAQRGKPLSVLVLDIDHFKAINDGHGHDAGDAVLREFAKRLRRNIRGIDLACRLGGEEFVVVMPDTDLGKAYLVGERLRQCIATEPFCTSERAGGLEITASVGVAALEFPDDTPDLILKRADQALYCAKRVGRNRVVADAA